MLPVESDLRLVRRLESVDAFRLGEEFEREPAVVFPGAEYEVIEGEEGRAYGVSLPTMYAYHDR